MREYNATLPFPLVVVRRTNSTITCRLKSITTAIGITVTRDLCVQVQRNAELWDVLLWLDCVPRRQANHYVCPFCPEDERNRYASRESLWRAQLFDPLAQWMNRLAAAKWLLLCESAHGGSTWARLSADPTPPLRPDAVQILPVHTVDGARDKRELGRLPRPYPHPNPTTSFIPPDAKGEPDEDPNA
ncbi:hypothetical protein [Noviherbaspirillum autotrophicum]|uniref:Uncharacterized protein n=1 Tax=Noviherbaspirillum autotrophicum TaxID=709839 RepID=A0A0C2BZ52_9BURK|nr:hypothetical protein [Noviherbaspirillum autotrophicum]KIF83296.1 hypothetical protein TSA66_24630 [Noviherbaspirillum autotrophicum]